MGRLLNQRQAAEYVGRSTRDIRTAYENGELGAIKGLKKPYFTTQELDRWQQKLTYHSAYISAGKSGMRVSRSYMKDKEYSFEKVLVNENTKRRKGTASNVSLPLRHVA
jgi:hypothetical protein